MIEIFNINTNLTLKDIDTKKIFERYQKCCLELSLEFICFYLPINNKDQLRLIGFNGFVPV